MAQAVISRAEGDGRLKPGDTVIEYTGGSTGASLALVCAALGYRIKIVRSDALSQEPHTYWTDQLNNYDSIAGYYSSGEELRSQTKGEIDAFVHCVGTAASSRGVATA